MIGGDELQKGKRESNRITLETHRAFEAGVPMAGGEELGAALEQLGVEPAPVAVLMEQVMLSAPRAPDGAADPMTMAQGFMVGLVVGIVAAREER